MKGTLHSIAVLSISAKFSQLKKASFDEKISGITSPTAKNGTFFHATKFYIYFWIFIPNARRKTSKALSTPGATAPD